MWVGIVVGSIREGRKGRHVGDWALTHARAWAEANDADVQFELIDLKDFDLPLLTAAVVPGAANRKYDDERVRNWSAAIDACDAYVFVTPEYNHGVPGAFKNAVDSLGPEWSGKTVAFVSYGADSGVRAVEQWRQIMGNFQMFVVRAQVSCSTFAEFTDGEFTPTERRAGSLGDLLTQLVAATRKLA
jgi:NAD(P)H-dependent FMN reductase